MEENRKDVIIEYTIKAVASVPEDWDKEDIEFHRNESSWCFDNFINEVVGRHERIPNGCCGWCQIMSAKYVGEATDQDKIIWNMKE